MACRGSRSTLDNNYLGPRVGGEEQEFPHEPPVADNHNLSDSESSKEYPNTTSIGRALSDNPLNSEEAILATPIEVHLPLRHRRNQSGTHTFAPSTIKWISRYIAVSLAGAALVIWPLIAAQFTESLHYGWLHQHHLLLVLLEVGVTSLALIVTRLPALRGSYATREAAVELLIILQTSLLVGLTLHAYLRFGLVSTEEPRSHGVEILVATGSILLCLLLRRRHRGIGVLGNVTQRNVLVVGVDSIGRALRGYIKSLPNSPFRFVGFVTLDDDLNIQSSPQHKEIIGDIRQVMVLAKSKFVDDIIFSRRPANFETLSLVVDQAASVGIDVRLIPSLAENLENRPDVQYIGDLPTIILEQRADRSTSLLVKRTSDIILASIAAIAVLPLCLIVAVAIKLQTAGPLFYVSKRVGYKGKIFDCYKFRTMIENAASMQSQLAHLNERDGILFKVAADPRITEVGLFLRKYSLDELPQLWNVLKGDMSLVGPRPSISSEVAQYKTTHLQRLDVVPGITGLWQVEARHDPSFDRYISLDLEYVSKWSLWFDLKILFLTLNAVLTGTGT
jgi:exopolysaccharide biosynthesis polyprenyl glycosylphosphotransferase